MQLEHIVNMIKVYKQFYLSKINAVLLWPSH